MNKKIVNHSSFREAIHKYRKQHQNREKKKWDAIDGRDRQQNGIIYDNGKYYSTILPTWNFNYIDEYFRLKKRTILWELKYQEQLNSKIQKNIYNKIYIWRLILIKINKRIFHDDICVSIIKYLI